VWKAIPLHVGSFCLVLERLPLCSIILPSAPVLMVSALKGKTMTPAGIYSDWLGRMNQVEMKTVLLLEGGRTITQIDLDEILPLATLQQTPSFC
jgi:hypothetical protein